MADWKIEKGPIDIDELQAYIQDLSDERNKESFPRLKYREDTLIITDILNKFKGKYRIVTTDSKGRKKLFDISDPLYSDGEFIYFDVDFVEMGWSKYYNYWRKLGTRPDVINWNGGHYIVYSFTKVYNEDGIYVVIGSNPNERITVKFDASTRIIRDHTQLGVRPKWFVSHAPMVMDAMKWD